MNHIKVQLAGVQYIHFIWKNIQESFNGPHSPYIATGQAGFKRYLYDYLENPTEDHRKIFVATAGGRFAAFADVILRNDDASFLTRIGVDPAFRGQGVAKSLMRDITENHLKINKWELDVLSSNSSALKWYASSGFKTIASKKWVGQELPTPPKDRHKLMLIDENYNRYGFTKVTIRKRPVSVSGAAIRCYEIEQFMDKEFLEEAQAQFPAIKRAFIVLDNDDTTLDKKSNVFLITRSYRMRGTF